MDSTAPVPIVEDVRRLSSRSMRAARDIRDFRADDRSEPVSEPEDIARLRAEREADADEIAAMLVRVADTERARDASEKRASGLETWTQELEEKVAAARTRADDAEELAAQAKRDLETARKEVERLRARVVTLEGELASARRVGEEAIEALRVKHAAELEALADQHKLVLASVEDARPAGASAEEIAKLASIIEQLEQTEAQATQARVMLFEQARQLFAAEHATAPPPPMFQGDTTGRSPTIPPTTRNPKKRSKRPPAPALPPKVPGTSRASRPTVAGMPAVNPSATAKLETFEDLELGDD